MKYAKVFFDKFEEILGIVLLSILVILLGWQITGRFVFYKNWVWHEEVIRICFIYMLFMGMALGAKSEGHIRVNILTDRFPYYIRKYIYIFSDLIWIIFNVIACYASIPLIKSMAEYIQRTPALNIPQFYLYFSIPFSLLLTTFRIIQVYYLRYRKTGKIFFEENLEGVE